MRAGESQRGDSCGVSRAARKFARAGNSNRAGGDRKNRPPATVRCRRGMNMAVLKHDAYGKSQVRLTKVTRRGDGVHELAEMSVDVQLEGEFARCYTHGDNTNIVATDSMKNT